jgi:hypothetical protein
MSEDCQYCLGLESALSEISDDRDKLKEENEKLKACVEFYSDSNSWDVICIMPDGSDSGAPVIIDDGFGGNYARKCLEEINKGK